MWCDFKGHCRNAKVNARQSVKGAADAVSIFVEGNTDLGDGNG